MRHPVRETCPPFRIVFSWAGGLEQQDSTKAPAAPKHAAHDFCGCACKRSQAGEFVLLLLVDSLLQLLLFSQPTSSQQDLSCDVSLVLLMDALFTALPLLLYRFGPWGALDNPPTTNSQGDEGRQAMKHEDAYFSRGPSAPAVAPPYTSWMGVRCRCCGRGFLNLP